MKTIKALFVIAFAVTITSAAKAQNFNYKLDGPFASTSTFKVNGVCEMCKRRIENALTQHEGIWSANWNVENKTLQVTYDRIKMNPDKIQLIVAAVGHDTEKFKAKDFAYSKLPDCCHYTRI